jgi:hypothetical protein
MRPEPAEEEPKPGLRRVGRVGKFGHESGLLRGGFGRIVSAFGIAFALGSFFAFDSVLFFLGSGADARCVDRGDDDGGVGDDVNALGSGDISDRERDIEASELAQIDRERVRNIERLTANGDEVNDREERAGEVLNGRGIAFEAKGNVGLDGLVRIYLEEVDVTGIAGAALALDAAKDDVARTGLTIDVEVNHGTEASALDGSREITSVYIDSLRFDALAVDVSGKAAFATKAGNFLAEHRAGSGLDNNTFSHEKRFLRATLNTWRNVSNLAGMGARSSFEDEIEYSK